MICKSLVNYQPQFIITINLYLLSFSLAINLVEILL